MSIIYIIIYDEWNSQKGLNFYSRTYSNSQNLVSEFQTNSVPNSEKWPGSGNSCCKTHACSSWWGYADYAVKTRTQAVLNKFRHLGFLNEEVSFVQICQEQDNKLFTQMLSEHHVLHQLFPPIKKSGVWETGARDCGCAHGLTWGLSGCLAHVEFGFVE